tara:strand:- start:285 stop:662 length:378 start_codon:yes stop_codon:yes gene_type:complete
MNKKLNNAYKTIGEVAELLNLKNEKNGKLNTYILRFWEKEFKQIKPKLMNNKRRYYDKNTINLLKRIKFLLKDQGMTIKGVKNIIKDERFILDDEINLPINTPKNDLKLRLKKISSILKNLKENK